MLAISLVATGCLTPTPQEEVTPTEEVRPDEVPEDVGEKPTERQEEPDPYIEHPQLVASYKYSGGVLVGAEVFTGVVNRGGAGSVEVVFIGRVRQEIVWTDSEII